MEKWKPRGAIDTCLQSFKCVSLLELYHVQEKFTEHLCPSRPKDETFAMEAYWILGMWTIESIPLKLFQGFEKNDEQFIILIIVFIAQTTVSLCSHESRDLKLRALPPAFPFSVFFFFFPLFLFNEPDCRSTPLLYAAPGTQRKLTPFCPTDRS